jgi:hypothetical protein
LINGTINVGAVIDRAAGKEPYREDRNQHSRCSHENKISIGLEQINYFVQAPNGRGVGVEELGVEELGSVLNGIKIRRFVEKKEVVRIKNVC